MTLIDPAKVGALLGLGAAAGAFSGLVGVGGGVIIVPALIYFLRFDQHQAQGTTLAMLLPPVGLLATWIYWKQGFVDVPVAAILCVGFFVGGWAGAKIAVSMPSAWLERGFALLMIGLGMKMLLKA